MTRCDGLQSETWNVRSRARIGDVIAQRHDRLHRGGPDMGHLATIAAVGLHGVDDRDRKALIPEGAVEEGADGDDEPTDQCLGPLLAHQPQSRDGTWPGATARRDVPPRYRFAPILGPSFRDGAPA
jgi:hypothetical protein